MSFAIPDTDTVYVDHLPSNVSEEQIAEYFGSIGVLKKDKRTRTAKIWLYKDKRTGDLKGDGTVTYEDPFAAQSAVEWFDNKEFLGSTLHVSLARRKNDGDDGGRGGGRGGFNKRFGERGRGGEGQFPRQQRNEGGGGDYPVGHNSYNSRPNLPPHSDGSDRRFQQRGGGYQGNTHPRESRGPAPSQPPMANTEFWGGEDRAPQRHGRGGYSDNRGWGTGPRGRGRGRGDWGDRRGGRGDGGRGDGGWGNRRGGRWGDDRRPPRDFGGRDHESEDTRGGNWRDSRGPPGRERSRSPDRHPRNPPPQREQERSRERDRHHY